MKFNVRSAKSEMIILVAKIVFLFFGFFFWAGGRGSTWERSFARVNDCYNTYDPTTLPPPHRGQKAAGR